MSRKPLLIALMFLLAASARAGETPTVRVDGSTTVTNAVFSPHKKKEIETAANVSIDLYPSSSGKGVEALLYGHTDIAMISTDLAEVLAKLKADGVNGEIPLQTTEIGRSQVVFVVNPANSVRRLTSEQLKGIFSGAITNWKDVGGSDAVIQVFAESPNGAMRTLIEDNLLHAPLPQTVQATKRATEIPYYVAHDPSAIGFVSSILAPDYRAGTVAVDSDVKLVQRLILVTKPDAKPEVSRVVASAEKTAHEDR